MTTISLESFDEELGLTDLLLNVKQPQLLKALQSLLGEQVGVFDAGGQHILGRDNPLPGCQRAYVGVELEPIGYIEAPVEQGKLQAVAYLLEQLLRSQARYRMASKLHLEAVYSDYEELQKKHRALLESEERYKTLAEHLEQRVQEQVKIIESAHRNLYQTEKMASIGQLAAGVAHEINNPIGFIKSNLNIAAAYVDKFIIFAHLLTTDGNPGAVLAAWNKDDMSFILEDFKSLLKESLTGVNRVASIVGDLKSFSNVDRAEQEIMDVNQILRTVSNVIASQLSSSIELKLELGEILLTRCRPGHLSQVFLNIILNAAKAIKEKGQIRVKTEICNNNINISISDNGCGIPEIIINRIFDPFFTTRDVGQGTGLGLTVSRDVVLAHGGHIEVESKEGKGSRFNIYLPVKK